MRSKGKILYLVAEDWYFCSHRLQLACAARDAGYEVIVATRVTSHGEEIKRHGLRLIPIKMCRRGLNPFFELSSFLELISVYRQERPDIAHHVALKPVLYGSIAAFLTKLPHRINVLAGLGYVYSSGSLMARSIRFILRGMLRVLLHNTRSQVILQNPDDVATLVKAGILEPEQAILIRGAGVDLKEFVVSKEPSGTPVVMLPSRMLWSKGVGEFVEAAQSLRNDKVEARFVLVGDGDPFNPASISHEKLQEWHDNGVIEWWGRCDDMPSVLQQAHIVCLPSYREGLPKVLLEAAASGRPIISSDAPGCREVVSDGESGILVPIKESEPLAEAMKQLISNVDLRLEMGERGRQIVEEDFSLEKVIDETLALYSSVLSLKKLSKQSVKKGRQRQTP